MKILKSFICFFLSITFLNAATEDNYILVTGGTGYIGLSTCRLLSEAGYTPITVDDFSNSQMPTISWGTIEQVDIRNKNQLQEIFYRYPFKVLFI